jgi:mRNA interferase MazF
MANDRRGEVWLVDLGYVAKTRPALFVSIMPLDSDRAIVAIVPHTTSTRGSRFEVSVKARFLKAGAFDAQNLITVSQPKLLRRLGRLTPEEFDSVMEAVLLWLGVNA